MNDSVGCDEARILWENDSKIPIDSEKWKNIRHNCFRMLTSTKMQFFHYRLISKKLTTNVQRNRFDNTVSPLCHFCRKKKETIIHIFTECEITGKFIAKVFNWAKYILNLDLFRLLSTENLLLSNYTGQFDDLVNNLTVLTKHYIYVTKCLNNELSVLTMLTSLHNMYNDEKFKATQENRLYNFVKKWSKYHDYCQS